MTDIKEFRALNLMLTKDDYWGIEALIAELSEIERMEIPGLSFSPTHFSGQGKLFVFASNSSLARQIMSSPEEIIELDMKDFKEDKIHLTEGTKTAYFHSEYTREKQKAIGYQETSDNASLLENCIEECLLTHHTDMYFTYIFRNIIYAEYEKCEKFLGTDLNEVFEKYKKLCAYVLMEACRVQTPEYNLLKESDFSKYHNLYNDLLEHGKLYCNVISTYVIYRDHVKEVILSELKDTEPIYPGFFQKCMIKGYEHALKRIENNLDNDEFFNHEFVETNDSDVIKIFPTPYGCLHKETLVGMVNTGDIDDALDGYLREYGIERVVNEELTKELETKYIFQVDGEDNYYYYKRRPQNDEYAPFGEQDRKTPIRSLIMQGQINLTKRK